MRTRKRDDAFFEAMGARIHDLRKALGMTGEELGKLCDEHQGSISQWERGTHAPTADKIDKIARALKTTPNHLYGWEELVEPERALTAQLTEALCEPAEASEPEQPVLERTYDFNT